MFFDYGAGSHEIGLAIGGGEPFAYEYDDGARTYNEFARGPKLPLGKWFRISITAQLTGDKTGKLDASIDGVPFATGAQLVLGPTASGGVSFAFGLPYTNTPHDGWTAFLDNVTFDAK